MIARTERSHLWQPTFFRPVTNRRGIGLLDGAIFLAGVQVFRPAVIVRNHPGGAVLEQLLELLIGEPDIPTLASA